MIGIYDFVLMKLQLQYVCFVRKPKSLIQKKTK